MDYAVSFDAVASISSGSGSAAWMLLLSFLSEALVFISISPRIPPLLAHSFLSRQFLFDRVIPVPQNLSNEHSTSFLFPVFNNVSPIDGFCLNFSTILLDTYSWLLVSNYPHHNLQCLWKVCTLVAYLCIGFAT